MILGWVLDFLEKSSLVVILSSQRNHIPPTRPSKLSFYLVKTYKRGDKKREDALADQ